MNRSDTVAIIRSILSSTKSTYSISRLNVDFKKETGIDIPLFGYGNVSDFLHSIPDTVRVSGLYPIQQVSLVKNEKSAHIISLVNRTRVRGHRQQNSSRSKDVIINGVRNIKIQKNSNINGVKHLEKFKDKKISEKKPDSTDSSSSYTLKTADSDFKVSLKNFLDVGESIPPIDITLHAEVGGYAEVCPCHIYTPQKFYFHFRKLKRKFADFMDKMQEFYKINEEIPEMTEREIKPKLMCAVLHEIYKEPTWCRGEINEIISKSHVIVTLVDYGVRAKVLNGNLRFLHCDFKSLPRQAVLGSLASIRPPKGQSEWSQGAIKSFNDLAFKKDLIAGVVKVDSKVNVLLSAAKHKTEILQQKTQNTTEILQQKTLFQACSMEVALSRTTGSELHINDALVNEGYAEFDTEILRNNFDLRNNSGNTLQKPVAGKSWRANFTKPESCNGKTVSAKESISKSVASRASSAPGSCPPVFYSCDASSDNKMLKKMFAV